MSHAGECRGDHWLRLDTLSVAKGGGACLCSESAAGRVHEPGRWVCAGMPWWQAVQMMAKACEKTVLACFGEHEVLRVAAFDIPQVSVLFMSCAVAVCMSHAAGWPNGGNTDMAVQIVAVQMVAVQIVAIQIVAVQMVSVQMMVTSRAAMPLPPS